MNVFYDLNGDDDEWILKRISLRERGDFIFQ